MLKGLGNYVFGLGGLMKNKINFMVINAFIISLLSIILGLANYNILPDKIIININYDYISKEFAIIFLPIAFAVLNFLVNINVNKKMVIFSSFSIWSLPIISNIFLIILINNAIKLKSPLFFILLFLDCLFVNFVGINFLNNRNVSEKCFTKLKMPKQIVKKIGYTYILISYFLIFILYLGVKLPLSLYILIFIIALLPIF